MNTENLKKELHEMIDNMQNDEALYMLKEECAFYSNTKKDITDDLSIDQLNELEDQLKEDSFKDTGSLDEFKQATSRWRTK